MTQEQRLLEAYQQAAEIHRIATRAVRKAQAESRRLGVANVYSRGGRLYYDPEEPIAEGPALRDRAPLRVPDPAIAGTGKTVGDLIAPAADENDWECLK